VFMDKNGHELSKIESEARNQYEPEQVLKDGEAVIGVYCDAGGAYGFWGIGLIVWTPPKF